MPASSVRLVKPAPGTAAGHPVGHRPGDHQRRDTGHRRQPQHVPAGLAGQRAGIEAALAGDHQVSPPHLGGSPASSAIAAAPGTSSPPQYASPYPVPPAAPQPGRSGSLPGRSGSLPGRSGSLPSTAASRRSPASELGHLVRVGTLLRAERRPPPRLARTAAPGRRPAPARHPAAAPPTGPDAPRPGRAVPRRRPATARRHPPVGRRAPPARRRRRRWSPPARVTTRRRAPERTPPPARCPGRWCASPWVERLRPAMPQSGRSTAAVSRSQVTAQPGVPTASTAGTGTHSASGCPAASTASVPSPPSAIGSSTNSSPAGPNASPRPAPRPPPAPRGCP